MSPPLRNTWHEKRCSEFLARFQELKLPFVLTDVGFKLHEVPFLYRHSMEMQAAPANPQWKWSGLPSLRDFCQENGNGWVLLEAKRATTLESVYFLGPVEEWLQALADARTPEERQSFSAPVSATKTNRPLGRFIHQKHISCEDLRGWFTRFSENLR